MANSIKSTSIKSNGRETNFFTPNYPMAETEKAIQLELIRFSDMETACKAWFPKSQIKFNPNEGLVEIPEWLLLTKTNANRLTMYA
jgi:hypothetical protein